MFQSCRENQNTPFMFNTIISKIVPFIRQCGKICYSQRGQDDMAHALCMMEVQAAGTRSAYVILNAFPRQQC
jgi:hypothetical protein